MKAEINGTLYQIINTPKIGEGNLTVSDINFFPDDDEILIPINNKNETVQLIYNLSYIVSLQKGISVIIIGGVLSNDDDDSTSTTRLPIFFAILLIAIIIL